MPTCPTGNSLHEEVIKRQSEMPLRICFLALGKFSHIDAYLDHFKERGYEVHFVALAPGPPRNVPTHNVGFNGRFLNPAAKWSYLPAMLRARRVVRSLAPDIVHAHYATSAGLAAFVCNVHPWVVTAHGTDVTLGVKSGIWRVLLRAICRKADCVNVVSDDLRRMILDLGTPPDKIETFSLGIDTKQFTFSERVSSSGGVPLRLICTRRLESVYDHATIIQSMAKLRKRRISFSLTLVGDGVMRKGLETLATKLGVRDEITFAGAVPNSLLPSCLARHDIYLSASTRDGTSLCLLEAMASGLYPVVSEIPANSEWIRHGHNGLLHKVSDPQSLADCIGSLQRGPEGRRAALLQNRELVVRRGDRTANMLRLEEVYRKLRLTAGSARPSGHRSSRTYRAGTTFRTN